MKQKQEANKIMFDLKGVTACRIGRIIEVGNHPSADSLYVEQIDLGEEKPRQVQSMPSCLEVERHLNCCVSITFAGPQSRCADSQISKQKDAVDAESATRSICL